MNYDAAKAFILTRLDRELSDKLYYHGKHHTLDVLEVAMELCHLEGIQDEEQITLVKTAALFHDAGFTIAYTQHEETGCIIVRNHLPTYGYSKQQIEQICGMIMATKIPQRPQNLLEKIICDADLDYLGRADFYAIGQTLFKELQAHNIVSEERTWNRIQVNFLQAHSYHTSTSISRRKTQKVAYLKAIKAVVATY